MQEEKEMLTNAHLNPQELIFGLDIGTRTVIGVVGYQKEDKFIVVASEIVEHESRAMIDGQIHDISKVTKAATVVKHSLEKQVGINLTQVAIAAAGRALRTYRVHVEQQIEEQKEIQKDQVKGLELEGIHQSQQLLQQELQQDEKYFCVGYSIVSYYLNGYMISNLEGHKGKGIGADVLATFLPQVVVDSLYSVMERLDLEVISLTLEPIAAINVAIPENLRLLNLALVDVGAGTSDIAITKDGSIIAYGMISVAGDEITEQIVHSYLVDFQTAEAIKLQLSQKDEISFTDILGLSHTLHSNEIRSLIEPAVERLAEEVASKIYEINGSKSPNAVFCVGGGSQIVGFTSKVSDKLKLPKERVAVRGSEVLNHIVFAGEIRKGPALITPMGICITALMHKGYEFMQVTVNGETVKLINTKKLTVLDTGMIKGFDHTNLIARKGSSLEFKINETRKKIWGQPGIPAELKVNGMPASLDTCIHEGDQITIEPAVNGESAKAFVIDYVQNHKMKKITLNGSNMQFAAIVTINGSIVGLDAQIHNHDEIKVFEINTVEDLASYAEISLESKEIQVNGVIVQKDHPVQDGDVLYIQAPAKVQTMIDMPTQDISTELYEPPVQSEIISYEPVLEIPLQVQVNGKSVQIRGSKKRYMFVDIFSYIDFDLKNPQGNIILLLNGQRAAFTDLIKQGDKIDIYWDKK